MQFGDFLGKTNNTQQSNENLNGGIPFSIEGLDKYNNGNNIEDTMFLQQDMNIPEQQYGMDVFYQQNMQQQNIPQQNIPQQNIFQQNMQQENNQQHNMQQQNMLQHNMLQHNMLQQNMPQNMNMFLQQNSNMSQPGMEMFPTMNGGKGKLPSMPILPNFFFHHI